MNLKFVNLCQYGDLGTRLFHFLSDLDHLGFPGTIKHKEKINKQINEGGKNVPGLLPVLVRSIAR